MVGLIATSSKRAFATRCATWVCCDQSPCPCGWPLLTRVSTGDTKTLKGRSGSVSVGYLLPGAHKVLFESSKCLWWMWGLIQNAISPLLPSCWGFSFALGCGFCFCFCFFLVGSNILLLMAVQQRVAFLESSQEKMSASPSTSIFVSGEGYFKFINLLSSFKFIGIMFLCEPVKTNANCSISEIILGN